MSSKLADIISKRRKTGEGVFSSLGGGIKDKLKEKFDPRQMINQKGVLAALFPGLKAYKALPEVDKKGKALSSDILEQVSLTKLSPVLEDISINTKIAAKNSLALPTMMRDVNLIRQNIIKLVKSEAETPATKADAFFQKSKEREQYYENLLKRERQTNKTGKKLENNKEESGGLLASLMSILSFKKLFDSIKSLGETFKSSFKWLGTKMVGLFFSLGRYILMTALPYVIKMFKSAIRGAFRIFSSSFVKSFVGLLFEGGLFYKVVASIVATALGKSFLQSKYGKTMSLESSVSNLGTRSVKSGTEEFGLTMVNDVPASEGRPEKLDNNLLGVFNEKYQGLLREGKMNSYYASFPSNDASPHYEHIPLTKAEAQELGTRMAIIKSVMAKLSDENVDLATKNKYERVLHDLINGVQVFMRNRLLESRTEKDRLPILEYADRAIEEFKTPGTMWKELSNLHNTILDDVGKVASDPVSAYLETEMNNNSLKGMIDGLNESNVGSLEPKETSVAGPDVDNMSRDNTQLKRDLVNQEPTVQVLPSVNQKDENNVKTQSNISDVYDSDFLNNHWMNRTSKEVGVR